jgi:hypothetical protein
MQQSDWLEALLGRRKTPLGKIFLSHSSIDKAFVRKLDRRLRQTGYETWLDEKELFAGDPLAKEIAKAIEAARLVIVVVSNSSRKSNWLSYELNAATRRMISGSCRVLPILIDSVEPPPELSGLLYADCRSGKRGGMKLVLETVAFEATRYPQYYEILFGPDSASGRMQTAESAVSSAFQGIASVSWRSSAVREVSYRRVKIPNAAMDSACDRVDMEIVVDSVSAHVYLADRNELNIPDWSDFQTRVYTEYHERFGLLLTQKAAGDQLRASLVEICPGVFGSQSENENGECQISVLVELNDNPNEASLRRRLDAAKLYFAAAAVEHARRYGLDVLG